MFCDDDRQLRGTLLPKKSSGHTFNEEIDTQQISWENLEVRIDKLCNSKSELECLGINVGDFIALDPGAEIIENNFIVSRYLDDKAGVAAILSAAKSIQETGLTLPVDCHLLFTISEEVGVERPTFFTEMLQNWYRLTMQPWPKARTAVNQVSQSPCRIPVDRSIII